MAMKRLLKCGPWTPMGTVDPPPSSVYRRPSSVTRRPSPVVRHPVDGRRWTVDGYGFTYSARPSSFSNTQHAYAPSAVPKGNSTRLMNASPNPIRRAQGR
jgi:hypothetical protein